MKTRKLGILVVVFLVFAFAKAQSTQSAETLLSEVATKFKGYENVVFSYKGQLENKESDLNIPVQGDAKLAGENYHVTFLGSTYIYDGNKLYIINREDEQVTISSVDENTEDLITPTNILTFYETGYKKSMDIKQDVRGRKIQYVKLDPIKSDSDYKHVLLGIDVMTKHIYKAIVVEKSGTVATFTLLSMKTDQPLPSNTFSFDPAKYDGWSIDEMN